MLAIPSGGVPVAARIARALDLSLHAVPVSKVLLPWTTESGYGAVAFDGSVWIAEDAKQRWKLTQSQIEQGIAEARAKVERRNARLRGARPLPEVDGRPVILVDDGIAAGSTMRAAIAALRRHNPAEIVIAVPTAHDTSLAVISKIADRIVCPNIRGGFSFAVADAYETWRDLEEDEVVAMLGL